MPHQHDEIPSDDEVLVIVRSISSGVTPNKLLKALCENGYEQGDVIRAIQRVFDRGLVELGEAMTLVETPERQSVAA